jgi:diacylglycerol kinase family enzyme
MRHAAIVAAAHETRLDVGRIRGTDAAGRAHERLFFDSASFGLAPDILAARNRNRAALEEGPLRDLKNVPILGELFRDQALYVGAAIDRLVASVVEPSRFSAIVTTDRFERSWLALTDLVVKATPIFAGAWVLDPEGEPDDGAFELVAVETRADWITRVASDLSHTPVRADQLGILRREHLSASRFEIDLHTEGGQGAVTSQLDGEDAGERFEIEVLANRLRLYTPADFVPPWKR